MLPVITLEDGQLLPSSEAFSWGIDPPEMWAIMGPSGSGKTLMLETLAKRRRPARGSVRIRGAATWAEVPEGVRRWTPQSVATDVAGRSRSTEVSEVLTRLGLWEIRRHHLNSLPPSLQACVALIPAILSENPVIVVDHALDAVDPWRRKAAWGMLAERRSHRVTLIATHHADLALMIGQVAVVKQAELVYRGSITDLLCQTRPQKIVVETTDPSTIRNLVAPVALLVEEKGNTLRITMPPGQEHAVELLLHGYGSVRGIYVQQPRLDEILMELCPL